MHSFYLIQCLQEFILAYGYFFRSVLFDMKKVHKKEMCPAALQKTWLVPDFFVICIPGPRLFLICSFGLGPCSVSGQNIIATHLLYNIPELYSRNKKKSFFKLDFKNISCHKDEMCTHLLSGNTQRFSLLEYLKLNAHSQCMCTLSLVSKRPRVKTWLDQSNSNLINLNYNTVVNYNSTVLANTISHGCTIQ